MAAAEATILADVGSLSTVSSGVDHQPSLLAEDLLTYFTGVTFGVDQVLVFVPQLIGGKFLITELAEEYFLLLPGMISQLVILTAADSFERFSIVTAGKSAEEMIVQVFVVLELKHQLSLVLLIIHRGGFWTLGLNAIKHGFLTCLAWRTIFSLDNWSITKASYVLNVKIIFKVRSVGSAIFEVLGTLGSHHKLILIDLEELADVADDRDVRLGETSNSALVGQLQHPVHLVRGKVGDDDTDLLLTVQLGHH